MCCTDNKFEGNRSDKTETNVDDGHQLLQIESIKYEILKFNEIYSLFKDFADIH